MDKDCIILIPNRYFYTVRRPIFSAVPPLKSPFRLNSLYRPATPAAATSTTLLTHKIVETVSQGSQCTSALCNWWWSHGGNRTSVNTACYATVCKLISWHKLLL